MDNQTEILLTEGKMLPLMEAFYSVQGEGYNTGKASFFIRVGGCDVGCHWCDVKESWNAKLHPPTLTDDIVKQVEKCPAKSVIVTGGEPLTYNMDYFCSEIKKRGFKTYLESSGSDKLTGEWDWIALSPKKNKPPVDELFPAANELKVIVSDASDFEWAELNAKKVSDDCILYLQPEWSKSDEMMQQIVDFVMENPRWQISLQSHKYMRIP